MRSMLVAITLSLGAAARLSPSAFCSIVDKAVTAVHQQSAATSFCSSYLHIPASTIQNAVTATATFYYPASCANPNAAKRTAAPEVGNAEIAARNVPKPPCLKSYTVASVLSSACSCLSIPPGTVTTGSTTTTPVTTFLTFLLKLDDLGPIYFYGIADSLSSQNIENIQCRFIGSPGVCTLSCVTKENAGSDPADGHAVLQICPANSAGNTWYLDTALDSGCELIAPVVVPVPN